MLEVSAWQSACCIFLVAGLRKLRLVLVILEYDFKSYNLRSGLSSMVILLINCCLSSAIKKMLKLLLEISILMLFSFPFHPTLMTYDAGREVK